MQTLLGQYHIICPCSYVMGFCEQKTDLCFAAGNYQTSNKETLIIAVFPLL